MKVWIEFKGRYHIGYPNELPQETAHWSGHNLKSFYSISNFIFLRTQNISNEWRIENKNKSYVLPK